MGGPDRVLRRVITGRSPGLNLLSRHSGYNATAERTGSLGGTGTVDERRGLCDKRVQTPRAAMSRGAPAHTHIMSEINLAGMEVLVVDDDPLLRRRIASILERLGAEVTQADSLERARRLANEFAFDLALLDVNLPDGLGTDLLRDKTLSAETPVIVITAHGGVAGAVEAMRLGAADYLVKPFETEELPLVIERARQARQSARVRAHRKGSPAQDTFYFGAGLASLRGRLEKILEADARMGEQLPPILLEGETGTGKTALARWIHQQGHRADRELVEVNCSALPEALAESELFGHERGAFTDARSARMGLIEAAHGGTLFLDELPSLPLSLQAKILTAIEDRKIRRVGGNKPLPVDCRFIAATQRDLRQLAEEGKFREDLYHRLDLYRVVIPPLRERGQEILHLTEWFLTRLQRKHRLDGRRLSAGGKERLLAYPWPGNVRELAHELERALVFEEGPELELASLAGGAVSSAPEEPSANAPGWLYPGFRFPETGFHLDTAIDEMVRLAVEQSEGNVSAAARRLGMPRDFVRYRLGLKGPRTDGH